MNTINKNDKFASILIENFADKLDKIYPNNELILGYMIGGAILHVENKSTKCLSDTSLKSVMEMVLNILLNIEFQPKDECLFRFSSLVVNRYKSKVIKTY
jgi:hypothetical protein